ncbi:hypothetical protein [Variovorax sp. Sphag1AA]|nr:hypothetical protein [Variovorax sp. Sphag1AA]MBB3179155.1 hypothetical protein [Variovorax sp. Sphag1AA]
MSQRSRRLKVIKNARPPSAGVVLQHAASAALAVAIIAGMHSIHSLLNH